MENGKEADGIQRMIRSRLNEKIAESRGKKTFWAILGPFSMYEAISVKPLDSDRLSSNAR